MGFLKNIKSHIKDRIKDRRDLEQEHATWQLLSQVDDEIARQTDWGPAKGGGTNMSSHHLVNISPSRVAFKATAIALLFPGIFMLMGLGFGIGITILALKQNNNNLMYFGIPFGSCMFFAGFSIYRSWTTPRVFDLDEGYYWRSRKQRARMFFRSSSPRANEENKILSAADQHDYKTEDICELKEIHAIQLIRELLSDASAGETQLDRNICYSYELNLILKDASRINVVDHGNKQRIIQDADSLSEFISVPVWNTL